MMSAISKGLKTLGGVIVQNSPNILTTISVIGLISAVVEGIRVTPTAMSKLDDEVFFKYGDEMKEAGGTLTFNEWLGLKEHSFKDRISKLTKKEILQIVWKDYLPTVIISALTISSVIGSNRISLRRSAALASLYGITEAAFKEYKTKVVETMGEAKERKVRDDIAQDRIQKNPTATNAIVLTGKGDVLCYDTLSGRYFRSDIDKIQRIVNSLNYQLRSAMFLTVNDLYYELGLSNCDLGAECGWDIDKGEIELGFSAALSDDGEPCLVLEYKVTPKYK
jgi:hypothetical protein